MERPLNMKTNIFIVCHNLKSQRNKTMLFLEKLAGRPIAVGSIVFNNKNTAKKQTKPLVIVQMCRETIKSLSKLNNKRLQNQLSSRSVLARRDNAALISKRLGQRKKVAQRFRNVRQAAPAGS